MPVPKRINGRLGLIGARVLLPGSSDWPLAAYDSGHSGAFAAGRCSLAVVQKPKIGWYRPLPMLRHRRFRANRRILLLPFDTFPAG